MCKFFCNLKYFGQLVIKENLIRFVISETETDRRRRRQADQKDSRIDWNSPVRALKQINTGKFAFRKRLVESILSKILILNPGYRKWAIRFLQDCPKQPETQAERAKKWNLILKKRYDIHRSKAKN